MMIVCFLLFSFFSVLRQVWERFNRQEELTPLIHVFPTTVQSCGKRRGSIGTLREQFLPTVSLDSTSGEQIKIETRVRKLMAFTKNGLRDKPCHQLLL